MRERIPTRADCPPSLTVLALLAVRLSSIFVSLLSFQSVMVWARCLTRTLPLRLSFACRWPSFRRFIPVPRLLLPRTLG